MPWYFVFLTWFVLTFSFYATGVWLFQFMHRFFPLRWFEVGYIMAAAVFVWWLVISAFAYPVI